MGAKVKGLLTIKTAAIFGNLTGNLSSDYRVVPNMPKDKVMHRITYNLLNLGSC